KRRVVVIAGAGRAGTMQKELVEEHALLGAPGGCDELLSKMPPDAAVHLQIAVGIPPPEIGIEDLSRQIVGEQTLGAVLDEREPAQPVEQLVRIAIIDDHAEQRFG